MTVGCVAERDGVHAGCQRERRSRLAGMDAASRVRFEQDGWLLLPALLPAPACDLLAAALCPAAGQRRSAGRRHLLAHPAVAALACSAAIRGVVEPVLGCGAFAVRAVLFDKVPEANWRVPWHRDRLVAVRTRVPAPGFNAWSRKDGVDHVEPPAEVLERMLALRLHLDAVHAGNGPLRVLSGSHRHADEGAVAEAEAVTIEAGQGAALLMRPLLRHASHPAADPGHRRVLHLEFAAEDLPDGVAWKERLGIGCRGASL
jgi:hypothetical protein